VNRNRRLVLEFKEGDLVILNYRNIKIIRPAKSLDYKNLGPFKVIRVINNLVYKLELFKSINSIFFIFYL